MSSKALDKLQRHDDPFKSEGRQNLRHGNTHSTTLNALMMRAILRMRRTLTTRKTFASCLTLAGPFSSVTTQPCNKPKKTVKQWNVLVVTTKRTQYCRIGQLLEYEQKRIVEFKAVTLSVPCEGIRHDGHQPWLNVKRHGHALDGYQM